MPLLKYVLDLPWHGPDRHKKAIHSGFIRMGTMVSLSYRTLYQRSWFTETWGSLWSWTDSKTKDSLEGCGLLMDPKGKLGKKRERETKQNNKPGFQKAQGRLESRKEQTLKFNFLWVRESDWLRWRQQSSLIDSPTRPLTMERDGLQRQPRCGHQ